MALTEQCKTKLQSISTATLNAVLFKRGLRNTYVRGIHVINPAAPRMVGPAYTLRYIPAREDLDHSDAFENLCHPQRKAVEECPPGAVFVIDAREDSSAASAGCILLTRLMKRGCAGVVTDGGFRDTPAIGKLSIPAYHSRPASPASLVRHHAVDINVPIGCGGVPVFPGDIVVGDAEGVVVIPRAISPIVVQEAYEQTQFEDFVQKKVEDGSSILGLYPPSAATLEDYERWRATQPEMR
jgi:regulator of RNase E activity RraA